MELDPSSQIADMLLTKSGTKQRTYRNVCKTFELLKEEAHRIVDEINSKTESKDEDITIFVTDISEHEFHLKVAGDLLSFYLHTNIITLSEDYSYNKSEYVAEDPNRKYLGQINVYNFMADSLKYNRIHDPGYLVARLLVNYENRFIVEGDRQVNFMFEAATLKTVERIDMNLLIQLIIKQAIENDLVAPPFHQIRGITLQQKIQSTEIVGAGTKIGFRMSSMEE